MKKSLAFVIVILFSMAPLVAKNSSETKSVGNDNTIRQKESGKSHYFVSFGTNMSGFPGEKGKWKIGYTLGITFKFRVYKNLSMSLPFSYNRINAALKNVEGKTDPGYGEDVYKTLSDWQIKVVFFEVPLLFTYKFLAKSSYDVRYICGPGLSFAVKDFSKLNFTRTDEILGISQYSSSVDPETYALRSSFNIITGVELHISRYYLNLLYTFYLNNIKGISKLYSTSKYPHALKRINNLNSISVKLSIDIF